MKKNVLFLIVFLIFGGIFAQAAETKTDNAKYIVYYFMSTPRCMTCNKIETETKKAVQTNFKKELEKGILTFKMVDIGLKENSHFKNDFKLFTKSVVLVEEKNGKVVKFENLQKIWELIHSEDKYSTYIKSSINKFLNK